jgi:hypothetical protein
MSELLLAEKLRMALLSERVEQIGMHGYSSERLFVVDKFENEARDNGGACRSLNVGQKASAARTDAMTDSMLTCQQNQISDANAEAHAWIRIGGVMDNVAPPSVFGTVSTS